MNEVDRFETSGGDAVALRTDGTRWEVARWTADGGDIWTETSVTGAHPFTEEEARAEFECWRT